MQFNAPIADGGGTRCDWPPTRREASLAEGNVMRLNDCITMRVKFKKPKDKLKRTVMRTLRSRGHDCPRQRRLIRFMVGFECWAWHLGLLDPRRRQAVGVLRVEEKQKNDVENAHTTLFRLDTQRRP